MCRCYIVVLVFRYLRWGWLFDLLIDDHHSLNDHYMRFCTMTSYKKKVSTVMSNNSTNIYNTNNQLSPYTIVHTKRQRHMAFRNIGPGLEQTNKCGGVETILGFHTLSWSMSDFTRSLRYVVILISETCWEVKYRYVIVPGNAWTNY